MDNKPKILILDDETDWLEMCREVLGQLPSKPEIRTASTGAHAVAQLDGEPFRLLICDLKMPRIDGLQVLAIVRRRFPDLRTVVLTGLEDEEFRSRAYALGVDLFWLKSDMQQNMKMFLDCLESLLGRDLAGGFRGIQNKSLMDIIQMECLSRNSTLLRLTRGPLVAKIWIQDGELIDAEVQGAHGEEAFKKVLYWKSGTFENLPAEPDHPRGHPAIRQRAPPGIRPVHGRSRRSADRNHRKKCTSQDRLADLFAGSRRGGICGCRPSRGRTRGLGHPIH